MTTRSGVRHLRLGLALVAVITLLAGACSGGEESTEGPPLSPLAAEGRSIVEASGCVSCHGRNGEGGVGPAWAGLHGTEVLLDDGTTVIADEAYLVRSIAMPEVERRDGTTLAMPANDLSDDEITAVVAYLQELP
ncbi:MAG: c-type cytochrome [Actinomycetota bacterium]